MAEKDVTPTVGENIHLGAFETSNDRENRTLFDDVPEGVFRTNDDSIRWPWGHGG